MLNDRALIARYFHRFGFGPKPGQFEEALKIGAPASLAKILKSESVSNIPEPNFETLGPRPKDRAILRAEWGLKMREQRNQLVMWWLDRMFDSDYAIIERMTWFWHGHWATSLNKVDYANAMLVQYKTLRRNSLGNFQTFSREMIEDGALQYWLDNNSNTVAAPNENLARELMELFVLGVNRYSEEDIKQAAKALTGYSLNRESGITKFNVKKHDGGNQTILGRTRNFDAISLTDFLVSRNDCGKFISERLWYRFINDATSPTDNSIENAFIDRDIAKAVNTLASHDAMKNESNSMVKPPLEWFISSCRALNILPSKLAKREVVLNYLDKLAQKPFYPPNVGGWPAGEIWLTAANAQYRIVLAQLIVTKGDVSPIENVSQVNRASKAADLLGVGQWSARTRTALDESKKDPKRLLITALCAPEYLVSV